MSRRVLVVVGACCWICIPERARAADISDVVKVIMELCVGRGSIEKLEAEGKGELALTLKNLRNLGTGGNVQVKYSKEELQGLTSGLSAAMTQVQADQADKVRECTKPYIAGIVKAMLQ